MTDYSSNILNDVESITGVDDDKTISRLKIYVRNATNEIEMYLGIDEIDEKLADIVQQMATAKFTKESFEGTSSASEEGLSLTFSANDLTPYMDLLNSWQDHKNANDRRGKVVSFD